ncbi:MAG: AMP-binding protein, partial [Solirubrobacteraceae bacterium]|nr:AMP-binding protein [Solirubrobacteraceae bacterium]
MASLARIKQSAHRAGLEARAFRALRSAGVLGGDPPAVLLKVLSALKEFGPFGATPTIGALKHPGQPAVADRWGELTFAELEERSNRTGNALQARGLGPGSTIGILCRNHRVPLIAAFAASRMGANVVWLNTGFSAPQLHEVAAREGVEFLVHDEAFSSLTEGLALKHGAVACATGDPQLDPFDALVASGSPVAPKPPARPGRIVLLTSGTTGTPKGAPRPEPRGLTIPGALLERLPLHRREATVLGAPLFHGTGLVIALITLSLGSKLVLRERFDPAEFLDDMERHHATGVCLVPVMLQRILALGDEEIAGRNLQALKVVFCAGSALPAQTASRAMDAFGDVVFNLYGSTEVSVATLATPADLRVAPSTVGKPALGCRVELFDDAGRPTPLGEVGRVFVGTTSPFEGYTGGGTKDTINGMMATGDVGHFDAAGRLYIDGRDDEMIVSGGENV